MAHLLTTAVGDWDSAWNEKSFPKVSSQITKCGDGKNPLNHLSHLSASSELLPITAFLIKKKKKKKVFYQTLILILVPAVPFFRLVQHVPGWRINQYVLKVLFHHLLHPATGKTLLTFVLHLHFLNCIHFFLPLHDLFFHGTILCGYRLANLESTRSPLI